MASVGRQEGQDEKIALYLGRRWLRIVSFVEGKRCVPLASNKIAARAIGIPVRSSERDIRAAVGHHHRCRECRHQFDCSGYPRRQVELNRMPCLCTAYSQGQIQWQPQNKSP